MIVGIAWIGASFYFNWLENRLNRTQPRETGIAGNLWAVHGGGFYHLKKFEVAPTTLPEPLHWFKWEAYTTWLSGMALLVVVYYLNTRAFVIDPDKVKLNSLVAVAIGLASITISWLVYDLLCKSPLKKRPRTLAISIFIFLTLLAWLLDTFLSSRAAFIHVGAAIGTIMVANVLFVIIPAQHELVDALKQQRAPDPLPGKNALMRSRHNNYFTLPVLFTMISNHFPGTYGNTHGWVVLLALSLISIAVRHYYNIRHLQRSSIWILPAAFIAMIAVMVLTAPATVQRTTRLNVPDTDIEIILRQRCLSCHSEHPTQAGFASAPVGLMFDKLETARINAERIYLSAVVTHTMPLGNLTGMTEPERALLGAWLEQQIQTQK